MPNFGKFSLILKIGQNPVQEASIWAKNQFWKQHIFNKKNQFNKPSNLVPIHSTNPHFGPLGCIPLPKPKLSTPLGVQAGWDNWYNQIFVTQSKLKILKQEMKSCHNQMFNKAVLEPVLEPHVSPVFMITYFCNHCNTRFDLIPVTVICMYKCTQGHNVQVPWKYITDHFSETLAKRSITQKWPLDDLWPHICWCLICHSTQGSYVLCPTPMIIHQSMWIQWLFSKT